MPTTAGYKNKLALQRRFKTELGINVGEDRLGKYFFKGMEDIVMRIVEEAVRDLLSNEKVLLTLAAIAARHVPKPKDGTKGDKGDRGNDGFTPVAGIDYYTAEEKKELLNALALQIKHGKDGITPKKGQDYFTEAEIASFKAQILEQVPSATGEDIVSKINALPIEPSKQIDAKHIKNLPDSKMAGIALHRGGLKLQWNTKLDGTVNGTNTVFTVPSGLPDPKDDKFIISVRGVLKTSDAGDFTASNGNRTISFTSAPPNGSDSPRIILYHGK